MLKNYFKVAFRHLGKQKLYSGINILGLGLGIATALLILLFIRDEQSYDQFHEKKDRIYRIAMNGGEDFHNPLTPMPLAPLLKEQLPEIQNAVRLHKNRDYEMLFSHGDTRYFESTYAYADSSFFQIFSFPLLQGSPDEVLKAPNTMVISRSAARKFFGEVDPVGKILRVENTDPGYTITGVMEDMPANSHFHFDFIFSFASMSQRHSENWLIPFMFTYIELPEGHDFRQLESKLTELAISQMNPQMQRFTGNTFEEFLEKEGGQYELYLQPLEDIHLHSNLRVELEANGDIKYIYIFSIVALLVLILAVINFVNLTTARATSRTKEVGVRKVVGAARKQLVTQFLTESLLQSMIATALAVLMVESILPTFNSWLGKHISLIGSNNWFWLVSIGVLSIAVGTLAGTYPAFYLSAFRPVKVLKGGKGNGRGGPVFLRQALVVTQFSVSVALVIGMLVISKQLNFMHDKDLGFQKEQLLSIPMRGGMTLERISTIKEELLENTAIEKVSVANYIPGQEAYENQDMFAAEGKGREEMIPLWFIRGDFDIVETLGLELLAGRSFNKALQTDSLNAYILNETAARQLGWNTDQAIGKTLSNFGNGPEDWVRNQVIGVVKDFHFEGFTNEIKPIFLAVHPAWAGNFVLRVNSGEMASVLSFLETKWAEYQPDFPFEYVFADERFGALWASEKRLGRVFTLFTFLALFIACLGLLGLSAYAVERRTKEVGIRKVLGASSVQIISLFSKDFLKLVVLAILIASPIAWYAMGHWLENFAYRTNLSAWIFVFATLLTLGIAFLTVSLQSLKAAVANPVKALRYE